MRFSSFRQHNKNPQTNISKEELSALTSLSKKDKDTYIKIPRNISSNQRKT